MIAKKKPQLIRQRRGSPGGNYGGLLLFMTAPIWGPIVVALAIIFIRLGYVAIRDYRESKAEDSPEVVNEDNEGTSVKDKPIEIGFEKKINPLANVSKKQHRIKVKPPRASQIILLIIMVSLIIGTAAYLLIH